MNAVNVKDLYFAYTSKKVLKGIEINIKKGEFVIIAGPNGAGKSTFLKCISGILKCNGTIKIFGKNIEEYSRNELVKLIAYVPQIIEPGYLTVFDTVLLGRRPYMGINPSTKDIYIVKNTLRRLGIEKLSFKITAKLSGGELQKVNIARALAQTPKILMMDEPTNNLDLKSQVEVMKIAKDFAKNGGTSIVVMHDINLPLFFGEHFVFLKNGRIVADSNIEAIDTRLFEDVYGIKVKIEKIGGVPVVLLI